MDGIDDGAGVLQLEAGSHTIPANRMQVRVLQLYVQYGVPQIYKHLADSTKAPCNRD